MGCDVKQQNPLDDMFETAKAMHWGVFCNFWDTCKDKRMCSIACPQGGVNDCSGHVEWKG